jgi:hypothetical protein
MQRNDDLGYLSPKCLELDPEPNEYPSTFASNLSFQTYNYSIEYLTMLKSVFGEIIKDFNNNNTNLEYAKKNVGLTMIFTSCVVRIVPMTIYQRLKTLYDHLTLDRIGENAKWDHFERIHRIYLSDEFSMAIIVSEKLNPIRDSISMEIKPEFIGKQTEIFDVLKENRKYLHEINIVHGDLSLDNTGQRPSDGKFVIFDFDGSIVKPNPTASDDRIRGLER